MGQWLDNKNMIVSEKLLRAGGGESTKCITQKQEGQW
jgi:hypothetical protein